MKKVLAALPNYSKYCAKAKAYLEENGCEVIENTTGGPLSQEQLKELVSDIDGAVAGVEVWNEEILSAAPKLKVLARFGVGVDNYDLEAAKRHGVVCTNCPGVNAVSVAEHAVMLMLNLLRECPQLNQETKQGQWRRLMVTELHGKTVGLLGFGAVARNVATILRGFSCHILAYDPYPNEAAAKELGVTMCSREEVLQQSDILSVHVPAMPETYHFIGKEAIALCKDGVYIVNTSRGVNADEAAVCEALESGKIAGYGSDVFEHEPVTKDTPIFKYPNYICTPHTAAESYENYAETGMRTADAILDVLYRNQNPWHRLV
ncbi:MAG: phosphoglycerate dehydrogenase [Lachnospiraceae bacterium]|nr:phosphoglycerate dehydrogenase [Lachnospiraceae bacterium]MDD7076549.1 phosphoglycerate dehydrogenase [Lachnospiraceae bacterium]MDY3730714.1 phosphoglycerate dehydrogenase [Candidatus Choladocola sp.]